MSFAEQRLFRTNGEWNRQRIKHHVKGFFGGGTPSTENPEFWTNGTIPWVSSKDMKVSRLRETQDYITEAAVSGSATNLVEPGSILMVVRSGILKHSIPTALNEVQVALNQDIKAFVLKETLDPEFFLYWVTGQQRDLLLEWGQLGATVDSLNIEILRNTVIPLPSVSHQKEIVAFLDHETGLIDGLIEKKTRFIALLKEKRAAVITHAVTKGIAPDAPMKESGNPWIGMVPKHWSVSPLKFLLARSLQYGATESGDTFRPEWPRYIRITDITMSGKLREDGAKSLDPALARPYLVKHGDLLLARSGATVGKSFLYEGQDDDACFAGYMIRASADREKLLPAYLNFFFQSHTYWEFILGTQSQSTIQNVSAEKYAGLPITVPSLSEQKEICAQLQAETGKIDGLITLTERSIDLLSEKRAALITAAVTGKIDVRAAA